MIRYCLPTGGNLQATKNADGSWSVEGQGSEFYDSFLDLTQAAAKPFNVSFFMTLTPGGCLDRLRTNRSDISSDLLPISTDSPFWFVPQPFMTGRTQLLSGYSLPENETLAKEVATVFRNVHLLEPQVYLGALFLITLFICFIALRLFVFLQSRGIKFIRRVAKEVSQVLYRRSRYFKLAALLFSILGFYISTSLLCLYKTSHIIIEEPFFAKSYLDSLKHPSSLAFYYDQFSVVSTSFRDAPAASLKNKLWRKLVDSGKSGIDLRDTKNFFQYIIRFTHEVQRLKSILIASSMVIPLLKAVFCVMSPEGFLWFVKIFTDTVEMETIYGYPIGESFVPPGPSLQRNFRRLFETHVISHHYKLAIDVKEFFSKFFDHSPQHRWLQQLACFHPEALAPHPQVPPVSMSYFRSFFLACWIVWLFAFVYNLCQIAHRRMVQARKEHRSVERRVRPLTDIPQMN